MKKVVAYIIMSATIFATMEVALKIAGSGLDPFQLTAIRFFIGGLVLLPPSYLERRSSGYKLDASDIAWMATIGIVGIPISMMAYQIGVMGCNASTAAPIFCINPMFAMVIAHLFTTEKMDKRKWIAFGLGIIAMFFMIRPWDVQEGNTVRGIVIMIFSAATFAAYSVMGKRSIGRIGAFTQTCISFITGSLILLAITVATGHPVFAGIKENIGLVAYVGFVVTGMGYILYFLAIRESDASTGSITFFIKPAIAPVFAILLLHESVYWNTVVGIVLLIVASVITITDAAIQRNHDQAAD
ncbi:MAG: DMT family transporter [Mogibacterium sp.]|nr:DMT family transporter [Mogibacterium sp.]